MWGAQRPWELPGACTHPFRGLSTQDREAGKLYENTPTQRSKSAEGAPEVLSPDHHPTKSIPDMKCPLFCLSSLYPSGCEERGKSFVSRPCIVMAPPSSPGEEEGTFELNLDKWSQLCSIWSEGVLSSGKSACKGPGVWSGTATLRTSRGAWYELRLECRPDPAGVGRPQEGVWIIFSAQEEPCVHAQSCLTLPFCQAPLSMEFSRQEH